MLLETNMQQNLQIVVNVAKEYTEQVRVGLAVFYAAKVRWCTAPPQGLWYNPIRETSLLYWHHHPFSFNPCS